MNKIMFADEVSHAPIQWWYSDKIIEALKEQLGNTLEIKHITATITLLRPFQNVSFSFDKYL